MYSKIVGGYLAYDKPVIIGEFGCCTYKGAEKLGGNGFIIMFDMMANYKNSAKILPKMINDMIMLPKKVDGHYVRDEKLQAHEITEQLTMLDNAVVEGVFVFTFVSPNSLYNINPKYDIDMASYSLVKSYPEKETVNQIISQIARQGEELLGIDIDHKILTKFASEVGEHGDTYPDMHGRLKNHFYAVADYYAQKIMI